MLARSAAPVDLDHDLAVGVEVDVAAGAIPQRMVDVVVDPHHVADHFTVFEDLVVLAVSKTN